MPATAPSISTLPKSDTDDNITLYRGVSSYNAETDKIKLRQYTLATIGIAAPVGMIDLDYILPFIKIWMTMK